MVLGKKVAVFDREWGRNSAPRDGQTKSVSLQTMSVHPVTLLICYSILCFYYTQYLIRL